MWFAAMGNTGMRMNIVVNGRSTNYSSNKKSKLLHEK